MDQMENRVVEATLGDVQRHLDHLNEQIRTARDYEAWLKARLGRADH